MSNDDDKFLYFGYGSNLLRERIHINNPSATMKTTAKLQDFKLDFNHFSQGWKGAAATVMASPGDHVWGVLWRLDMADLPNLDRQEGVERKIYKPMEVEVETKEGETLKCRTYQMILPWNGDHKPSPQYKKVIVDGANQNGLPRYYIEKLERIPDNGYTGNDTLLSDVKCHR